jgi:acetyl esterase
VKWLLDLLEATLPAVTVNGETLDARVRALLWLGERRASIHTLEPAVARVQALQRQRLLPVPANHLAAVEDFEAAGLAMRRYTPNEVEAGGPALLFFHGGGFVIGGLDSHDTLCRLLADHSGVEIIAVDYRLAPEHPFPAAADDALAAWTWFKTQPHTRHLAGGDSAGGNLAMVIAQQVEDRPDALLLIYPATDRANKRPSRDTYATGFMYTSVISTWFKDHYLPPGIDRSDPRVSPLLFDDLSEQPPAHVLVAGFDILRDEIQAYIERLKQADVPLTVQLETSLPHGFTALAGASPTVRAAIRRCAVALRTLAHPKAGQP